jgi:hypothetical protein
MKALYIIKLSVKDQIIPYILNVKNPKACWDVLKRRFEITNNARRLAIRHKFSNLHMEEALVLQILSVQSKTLSTN